MDSNNTNSMEAHSVISTPPTRESTEREPVSSITIESLSGISKSPPENQAIRSACHRRRPIGFPASDCLATVSRTCCVHDSGTASDHNSPQFALSAITCGLHIRNMYVKRMISCVMLLFGFVFLGACSFVT
jgi:hypothetical protein